MLTLTKSLFALMIGFIISIVVGVVIVPLLRKIKAKQTLSSYLFKKHKEKEGTPTMGGLIFIIPTFVITLFLLLTGKIEYSEQSTTQSSVMPAWENVLYFLR